MKPTSRFLHSIPVVFYHSAECRVPLSSRVTWARVETVEEQAGWRVGSAASLRRSEGARAARLLLALLRRSGVRRRSGPVRAAQERAAELHRCARACGRGCCGRGCCFGGGSVPARCQGLQGCFGRQRSLVPGWCRRARGDCGCGGGCGGGGGCGAAAAETAAETEVRFLRFLLSAGK
jgi:hypothetical protein